MITINEGNKEIINELENYLRSKKYYNRDGLLVKPFYIGRMLAKTYTPKFYRMSIVLEHEFVLLEDTFSTFIELKLMDVQITIPLYNYPDSLEDKFLKIRRLFTDKYGYFPKRGDSRERSISAHLQKLDYTSENLDKYIYKMIERDLPRIIKQADMGILVPKQRGRF